MNISKSKNYAGRRGNKNILTAGNFNSLSVHKRANGQKIKDDILHTCRMAHFKIIYYSIVCNIKY